MSSSPTKTTAGDGNNKITSIPPILPFAAEQCIPLSNHSEVLIENGALETVQHTIGQTEQQQQQQQPVQPAKDQSKQSQKVKDSSLSILRDILREGEHIHSDSEPSAAGEPFHAYLLPRTDAHGSEYLCERDLRVQFISGFSGTSAYVVVTEREARLWTDGRYFIQAAAELRNGWTLMKQSVSGAIDPIDWCLENLEPGSRVAFDPSLMSIKAASSLMGKFGSANIVPIPYVTNLVDLAWADRPQESPKKVIHLSANECGEEVSSKLSRVADALRRARCDSLVLSQLDDIAWLFNLRGADIPFNPVFFSYAFVNVDGKANLFIDLRKMTTEVASHLKSNGVEVYDYGDIFGFLKQYHDKKINGTNSQLHKIWLPETVNYALGSLISKRHAHIASSPVQQMKAIKNLRELEGMRRSHVRDSAALVKFFFWLRNELELGHLVDENRAARQCNYYREQLENFVSLSFETISAADEHAALPHYHPDEDTGKKLINHDSVYLLDSGGQYRDGTTDVTRTVCFAEQPDEHFRRMFTLVFKSHVGCALAKFPDGTYGMNLDGLTRAPLWQYGYDFGHGVGHGVGHFLNVHEGPLYIGYRVMHRDNNLHKGCVVTIEPGYYAEGKFGVRFENCYEVVEAKGIESGADNYVTFCPLTFVPVQKSLLIRELLDQREIDWLNRYHNQCLELIGRYLQEKGMQREYNFLAECCTPF